MAHKIKALAVSIGATLALASFASHAEITLLKALLNKSNFC